MCHKVTERPGNKLTSFVYCTGIIENPFLHPCTSDFHLYILILLSTDYPRRNINISYSSHVHYGIALILPLERQRQKDCHNSKANIIHKSKVEATQSDIVKPSLTIIKIKILGITDC